MGASHMVRFKPSTVRRLKTYGAYGETLDDIANKLMDMIEPPNLRLKGESK